ncbi:MAG: glycosyltransferase [Phycisphaerales bacterium]
MISYVIPTKDRHAELARTLDAIGSIAEHGPGAMPAEVIVVDNASDEPARAPNWLPNGVAVRVERLHSNEGAAGRNAGVLRASAQTEWVVMLDDDSAPMDGAFVAALDDHAADVGAVSADIFLSDGSRERGGLPEVFIGCGVAIRRWAFLASGGYDPSFGYYAEEYDLAAKLMLGGRRIAFDPRFRVLHRKVPGGRDMDVILRRLVRNNGWVLQRYAPDDELEARLGENEARYRAIADKEHARAGFDAGLEELKATLGRQRRTPMDRAVWDRFTGLAAARAALREAMDRSPFETAQIVEPGKNAWVIERALRELGVEIVEEGAVERVVGTMSPGPMLDAGGDGVITPWSVPGARGRRRVAA